MDKHVNIICNRLSLRKPQSDSLEILSKLSEKLNLSNNADIESELQIVRELYPTCVDFERNFTSLCFALATGVGKTRLMGAFVSYLYLSKKIKHYFVLAPNLTIYNKLIADFSDVTSPKYVFKGIGEFATNPPRIITGDNYNEVSQNSLFDSEVHVNIFNISKINAETRGETVPRIKRLSEYLGESYFNYLSKLEDLVILMDESHHYRADRGMQVINELKPVLGLELTATPQVEKSGKSIKFKNVVYEYSLAKAIQDGFVKEPSVATRRNFDPSQYSNPLEIDRIKIEDGVRIHEDTKVALDIYSRETKTNPVKPFVLIVAKETNHAAEIKNLIQSKTFFDGYYMDKVLEIHSNQKGSEKEENIQQLLSLENPYNKIEIVIHVNMLKEGWDVTNLYTIVPLRASASSTLTEQTIGRGLRLPFGNKTGNSKADKLTIVSHDRFQEIIDAANHPDSIIKKENIIEIDEQELTRKKEAVTIFTNYEAKIQAEEKHVATINDPTEQAYAKRNLEIKRGIVNVINKVSKTVKSYSDLNKAEVKVTIIENLKKEFDNQQQKQLFVEETIKEAEKILDATIKEYAENIIEIPRIVIQQSGNVRHGFHHFDLDVRNLNFQPVSEEILRQSLKDNTQEIIQSKGRGISSDTPENILVNELINFPEVDYDSQSDLLFHLSKQAIEKYRSYLDDKALLNVVQYHKRQTGQYIYTQMMEHFYLENAVFEEPIVYPFEKILDHNYSKYSQDSIKLYTETITPSSLIPGYLFTGFIKSCHASYKFDSKTEKDFAIILENDKDVIKWLRPAPNQFRIYWAHNSKQYEPDFVVETQGAIYMIETKASKDMESAEVQEKALAALEYCKHATDHTTQNNGKAWKYVIIPHDQVQVNMGFGRLVEMNKNIHN
ncbi:MAG: type III restriction endonuclease subunit R [Bacteroidetes bacterium HGW-Bacteroidetes-21]|nr:MAG: type III restriction endonuclease subunit R [Bacteroidetes bacterium HGW-Bacteroidetes-21]